MLIPHSTLILVVDGAHGRLFQNRGTNSAPKLELIEDAQIHIDRAHNLVRDRAGRSFESATPARHAHEGTDRHERAEIAFARDRMRTLLDHARPSIPVMLIAPPDILGQLRQWWGAREPRLAEIDKDLTHLTPGELTRYLIEHR